MNLKIGSRKLFKKLVVYLKKKQVELMEIKNSRIEKNNSQS